MARPLRTAFQNIRANAIDRRNQRRQRRTGDYQVPMNNMDSMAASDKSNVSEAGHFRTAQTQVAGGYMVPKGELPQPQKAQVGADTKDVNANRIYPQVDPTNLAKQGGSKMSGPAGPKGVADSKAEDSTLPPLPRQQTTARNPDVITTQGQQAAPLSRELPNYYNAGPQQQTGMPPMAGQGRRRGIGGFIKRGIGALLHMPQQTDNSQEEASRRQDIERSYLHHAEMQRNSYQFQRDNAEYANQMNNANRTEQSRQEAPATQLTLMMDQLKTGAITSNAVADQLFTSMGLNDATLKPAILEKVQDRHFDMLENPLDITKWSQDVARSYAEANPKLEREELKTMVAKRIAYLTNRKLPLGEVPMQEQQQVAASDEPEVYDRDYYERRAKKNYAIKNRNTQPQPLGY